MKNWNKPEIEELKISKTAEGFPYSLSVLKDWFTLQTPATNPTLLDQQAEGKLS